MVRVAIFGRRVAVAEVHKEPFVVGLRLVFDLVFFRLRLVVVDLRTCQCCVSGDKMLEENLRRWVRCVCWEIRSETRCPEAPNTLGRLASTKGLMIVVLTSARVEESEGGLASGAACRSFVHCALWKCRPGFAA